MLETVTLGLLVAAALSLAGGGAALVVRLVRGG